MLWDLGGQFRGSVFLFVYFASFAVPLLSLFGTPPFGPPSPARPHAIEIRSLIRGRSVGVTRHVRAGSCENIRLQTNPARSAHVVRFLNEITLIRDRWPRERHAGLDALRG